MHYKKPSWKEVIDPAFDDVIRLYLWAMGKMHLPSSEGYLSLALEENEARKMELSQYPSLAFLYEKDNVEDSLIDLGVVMGFDITKKDIGMLREASKDMLGRYALLTAAAEQMEDESKKYYFNAFDLLSSKENYRKYFLDMDEKEQVEVRERFVSDVLSLICHAFKVDLIELKEKAKTDEMRTLLRNKIMGKSSILRKSIFSTWNNISLLVHKKSLKQLYKEAKGDDKPLFDLMQIDKTLFDHDWVRKRIRKAAYTGDWKFFHSLSEAIRRDPLANRKIHGDALLVLLTFWKICLFRLSIPQLMELLKDSGLRMRYDEVSFRAFVDRQIKPLFKTR